MPASWRRPLGDASSYTGPLVTRVLAVVIAVVLPGCDRLFGLLELPVDSTRVPDCSDWPQPPTGLDPCNVATPSGSLVVDGLVTYHTDTGELDGGTPPASQLDTTSTPNVRIVSIDALSIRTSGQLRVVGPHPVVFVVHGAAEISGTLDASAWFDTTTWHPGPGGEAACVDGAGEPGPSGADGAGGGGGGGHGADGGDGGAGDAVGAGRHGNIEGSPTVSPLRGGCRGGTGGDGDGAGGLGGRGAGGVQVAARDAIVIASAGSIRANGGPGAGGNANNGGGGGGGSGGAILLEGASITAMAGTAICANGGGGGGGASDEGGDGAPGTPGTCTLVPAQGGLGGTGGGSSAGAGGASTTPAGPGKSGSEGGGGGGGGVGRIRLDAPTVPMLVGTITPVPV